MRHAQFSCEQMNGILKQIFKATRVDIITCANEAAYDMLVSWKIPWSVTLNDQTLADWMGTLLIPLADLTGISQTPEIRGLEKTIKDRDAEIGELKQRIANLESDLFDVNNTFESYKDGVNALKK